jgi:hypothetical protein
MVKKKRRMRMRMRMTMRKRKRKRRKMMTDYTAFVRKNMMTGKAIFGRIDRQTDTAGVTEVCLFRFMICCDRCNEWFHGDCVGITVEAGMEMDANEEDYICPVCLGKVVHCIKAC